MNRPANPWFRSYWSRPHAAREVYIFPHGGGAASFYRPLARHLPPEVEPLVVQYPGREDRLTEPCFRQMAPLADALAEAVASVSRRPFLLFGHSMGASVAFEVADRLACRYGMTATALVASGRPGPRLQKPGCKHLDDEALWSELDRLSGTASELIGSDELRRLVLPRLRADYQLIERYRPSLRTRLSCPVAAWTGDADPEVRVADAMAWREATTGPFELTVFPGDHFYLRGGPPDVAASLGRIAVPGVHPQWTGR